MIQQFSQSTVQRCICTEQYTFASISALLSASLSNYQNSTITFQLDFLIQIKQKFDEHLEKSFLIWFY
jgi:hypothetical protein